MKENLELIQMLTARICHDLGGSISTIDNCLGLMSGKDQSIRKQAKLLVQEESSNLVKKIQVFRECYGAILNQEEMSITYLTKVLNDLFASNNVQMIINFEDGILSVNALLAKTVMCLSSLAKEQTKIEKIDLFFNSNSIKIAANIKGPKLKKDNFWQENSLVKTPISPNNVRQHYISMICDVMGYKITVSQKEKIIEYILEKI